ncbi:MAG: 50S ribosomal protein L24 [Deltaproteobacteria bacterium]
MKTSRKKTYLNIHDRVEVICGRDRGKIGKIISIDPAKEKIRVEGVNIVKRHTKPGPRIKGGIIEKEAPIHISNVLLICPKCTKSVRIGKKILDDGTKVRICKKCGEVIRSEARK